jgi:hypothetical protein
VIKGVGLVVSMLVAKISAYSGRWKGGEGMVPRPVDLALNTK